MAQPPKISPKEGRPNRRPNSEVFRIKIFISPEYPLFLQIVMGRRCVPPIIETDKTKNKHINGNKKPTDTTRYS